VTAKPILQNNYVVVKGGNIATTNVSLGSSASFSGYGITVTAVYEWSDGTTTTVTSGEFAIINISNLTLNATVSSTRISTASGVIYDNKQTASLSGITGSAPTGNITASYSTVTVSNTPNTYHNTQDLSVSITGGETPFTIDYYWIPSGTSAGVLLGTHSGVNGYSDTFTQTVAGADTDLGTVSYYAVITDSSSTPYTFTTNQVSATVVDEMVVSVSPTTQSVGSNVNITISGDVSYSALKSGASLSYNWYAGSSCSGTSLGTGLTYSLTTGADGTYYYSFTAVDSYETLCAVAKVIVSTTIEPILSSSASVMNVGQDNAISVSVQGSGGSGQYTYAWSMSQSSDMSGAVNLSSSSPMYLFSPSSAGTYYFQCKVDDTVAGTTAESNIISVSVNDGLSISTSPLSATITAKGSSSLGTVRFQVKNNATTKMISGSQVRLNINFSLYQQVLNSNASNLRFYDLEGNRLYAWLEGGLINGEYYNASMTLPSTLSMSMATESSVWVKINRDINADGGIFDIYMIFDDVSSGWDDYYGVDSVAISNVMSGGVLYQDYYTGTVVGFLTSLDSELKSVGMEVGSGFTFNGSTFTAQGSPVALTPSSQNVNGTTENNVVVNYQSGYTGGAPFPNVPSTSNSFASKTVGWVDVNTSGTAFYILTDDASSLTYLANTGTSLGGDATFKDWYGTSTFGNLIGSAWKAQGATQYNSGAVINGILRFELDYYEDGGGSYNALWSGASYNFWHPIPYPDGVAPTITVSGGNSLDLTTYIGGGSGDFTVNYFDGDSLVSGGNKPVLSGTLYLSKYSFSTASSGMHGVYAQVVDTTSNDVKESNLVPVEVLGGMSVSISPTSVVVLSYNYLTLTANVSGGSGNYRYIWYENAAKTNIGATQVGVNSSVFHSQVRILNYETIYYYVVVYDNNSGLSAVSNYVEVTVANYPVISISSDKLTALANGLDYILFSAQVSEGSGNYTYQWYVNNEVVGGETSAIFQFRSTSVGNYTVMCEVSDTVTNVVSYSNGIMVIFSSAIPDFHDYLGMYDSSMSISLYHSSSGTTTTYEPVISSAPFSKPSTVNSKFGVAVNGVKVGAYEIKMQRQLNGAGMIRFTVSKKDYTNVFVGGQVQMWFLDNLVFTGFIQKIKKKSTMEYDVEGYDALYNMSAIGLNSSYGLKTGNAGGGVSLSDLVYNALLSMGTSLSFSYVSATPEVGFGYSFSGDTGVIYNLTKLLTVLRYGLVIDATTNHLKLIKLEPTTVVDIVEDGGISIGGTALKGAWSYVVKKDNNSNYYANTIFLKMYEYDDTTEPELNVGIAHLNPVGNVSANTSSSAKTIDFKWLYGNNADLSQWGTGTSVATQLAKDTLTLLSQQVKTVVVWSNKYIDIASGYSFTVNFKDGSSWSDLYCTEVEVNSSGYYLTLQNFDEKVFSYPVSIA